ncbi:MAG: GNAT family N-acetyltransferase, partial [Anaerolineales bacterium]
LALFSPVEVSLFGGLSKHFASRSISYGSVLTGEGQAGQDALSLLLQTYTQQTPAAALFTELRNISDPSEMQELLQKTGYVYEDHLNYLLDLEREPREILKSFKKDAYRRIRKNMKREVIKVREIHDISEISTFYSLLKKTYQYAHIPLADISLFEAAFDVLHPKKMIRFTLVYVEDVPVTASASLLYKDIIYGWYNGTDREYRNYGPNEFEVWELINWGIENGYRVFDFGGAGKPGDDYGVRDFKAKFNGQLVNYGRNIYVHAPIRMKLSKMSYEITRNFLQFFEDMINNSNQKRDSTT